MSRQPFPAGPGYEPPYSLDATNTINAVPQLGKPALFDIDFTPIIQDALGTIEPPQQAVTFFVRLIACNGQKVPVGNSSNTVNVVYQASTSNTTFPSMKISFTSLKCLDETDWEDGDSDEVYAVFFAADLTTIPPDSKYFVKGGFDDMDAGETEGASTLVFEYTGPGYDPAKLIMLVALMEEDDQFISLSELKTLQSQLANQQKAGWSLNAMRTYLIDGMNACLDHVESEWDHDRIGGVQQLQVPLSDWHKLNSGEIVAPRTLTFCGDGGKYELTFGISK